MPHPRIPLEPGRMFHVWTHANGSENLFRSGENYYYFLEKYSHHVYPVVGTFAYCLMPNHIHLMIRVREEETLMKFGKEKEGEKDLTGFENLSGLVSKQFSNLFNAYTKAYNKMYERKGSLFERAFHRKLIDSDEYFTQLIVYIHNNPIHHGFVKDVNDWFYSSWHAYLADQNTKIKKSEALEWFGGKQVFIKVHQNLHPEKLTLIFEE